MEVFSHGKECNTVSERYEFAGVYEKLRKRGTVLQSSLRTEMAKRIRMPNVRVQQRMPDNDPSIV